MCHTDNITSRKECLNIRGRPPTRCCSRRKKKRDREGDRRRRRHDREESETEGMRGETRQGDRDRVGEAGGGGGGGFAGRVGKGNRQPVYYQGSIEKHLGTNRTPPPCHPKPFSLCQCSPFSQTPWGSGRGWTERRKLGRGGGAAGGGGGGEVGGVVGGQKMEYPSTTPA